MREKLGILLMEDENGEVAVQLFAEPDSLAKSFAQLKGKPSDPPRRATFIRLEYNGGRVEVHARELPVPEPSKEDAPDGYRLGEGPIHFDKEERDATIRDDKKRSDG